MIDRPTAPHFVRAIVDRVTGTATPTAREAEQAVTEAKQREEQARAAAAAAKAEREAAEREIPAARARAKEAADNLARASAVRLKALEEQLEVATRREAASAGERPTPDERLRARSWLHTGGSESGRALMELAALDAPLAGFLDCQQSAGRLMKWLFDSGASDEDAGKADDLEVRAWGLAMTRVRHLAGES